eukprot:g2141.t1
MSRFSKASPSPRRSSSRRRETFSNRCYICRKDGGCLYVRYEDSFQAQLPHKPFPKRKEAVRVYCSECVHSSLQNRFDGKLLCDSYMCLTCGIPAARGLPCSRCESALQVKCMVIMQTSLEIKQVNSVICEDVESDVEISFHPHRLRVRTDEETKIKSSRGRLSPLQLECNLCNERTVCRYTCRCKICDFDICKKCFLRGMEKDLERGSKSSNLELKENCSNQKKEEKGKEKRIMKRVPTTTTEIFQSETTEQAFAREEFNDKLHSMFEHLKDRPPRCGGVALNFFDFRTIVSRLGGFNFVKENKLWQKVAKKFEIDCTSSGYQLRVNYEKYIIPVEKALRREKRKRKKEAKQRENQSQTSLSMTKSYKVNEIENVQGDNPAMTDNENILSSAPDSTLTNSKEDLFEVSIVPGAPFRHLLFGGKKRQAPPLVSHKMKRMRDNQSVQISAPRDVPEIQNDILEADLSIQIGRTLEASLEKAMSKKREEFALDAYRKALAREENLKKKIIVLETELKAMKHLITNPNACIALQ